MPCHCCYLVQKVCIAVGAWMLVQLSEFLVFFNWFRNPPASWIASEAEQNLLRCDYESLHVPLVYPRTDFQPPLGQVRKLSRDLAWVECYWRWSEWNQILRRTSAAIDGEFYLKFSHWDVSGAMRMHRSLMMRITNLLSAIIHQLSRSAMSLSVVCGWFSTFIAQV